MAAVALARTPNIERVAVRTRPHVVQRRLPPSGMRCRRAPPPAGTDRRRGVHDTTRFGDVGAPRTPRSHATIGPWPTSSSSTAATDVAWNASATCSSTGPHPRPSCHVASSPPSGSAPALRWTSEGWARGATKTPWTVRSARLVLECRPASGGQVGVFAEHAGTWDWLQGAVAAARAELERPPEILSLFAYTGGATLACARSGARVAHVDASKPAVAWARQNAELSGLADRPVRWLVDDVRSFLRRERRRGRRYDGVVVDPPSYGHGPVPWKIETDLEPLLDDLAALLGPRPSLVVLSAHTEGFDGERLAALCREHLGVPSTRRRSPADRAQRQRASTRQLGADPGPLRPSAKMGVVADLVLSSTRNPRVKAVAALRDRRARDEAGLTLIDGVREVARAVAGGAAIVEVYVDRARLRDDGVEAMDAARAAGAEVVDCAPFVLDRLAYGDRGDGIVAVARIPDTSLDGLVLPADPLLVVVEGVEKPGNLGAVLRSADGAGADAVIAADPRTDLFNPNAVRASQGTLFALPVAAGPSPGRAHVAPGPGHHRRRGEGGRHAPLFGRRPPRTGGARPRQRGDRAHGRLVGRRRRRRSACRCWALPTASTCRSPRPSCCTRRGDSATSAGQTNGHADLRLRDHRRRPGRRGRRAQGSRARRDRRHRRPALVRRLVPPHRLRAVEGAAPFRRAPLVRRGLLVAACLGASRLHGQPPGRRRRAGRPLACRVARGRRARPRSAAPAGSPRRVACR